MGDRQKKSALFEEFARIGKAMGHGKRLELIDLLAQGERSVENLAATAGLGLSTASAHLQTLKLAGLVTTRKDGARIYYDLAGPDVAGLFHALRTVARARLPAVDHKRADYLGIHGSAETDATGTPLEVTREELLSRAAAGTVTVLDVRPPEEYRAAHIPGALSIPLDELACRIGELPAGQEVVVYCRGAYCVLAYEAVDLLQSAGHRARRLNDGMLEWRLDGLPVDVVRAA